MSAVAAGTVTLTDLAKTVNRLIVERSDTVNPRSDYSDSCLYFDRDTGGRCLIGQALFELTGRNVPAVFEEKGINLLFSEPSFCEHFGLTIDDYELADKIILAQARADSDIVWGQVIPIDIPA